MTVKIYLLYKVLDILIGFNTEPTIQDANVSINRATDRSSITEKIIAANSFLSNVIRGCVMSPPGTSLPGSWRDTCRFLRCLRGGQQEVFWRPLRRRRGATPCERTENEELG